MMWVGVQLFEDGLQVNKQFLVTVVILTVLSVSGISGHNHHNSNHNHSNQGHHNRNQSHSNHKHSHSNHEKSTHSTTTSEESYTIVYPQVIENKAGIIVNDVKSYVRRRKRTLGGENKPLEISISGGKEMFDLELWENEKLLAPGFKIYRRQTLKQVKSEKEVPQEDVYGCHFTGHVKSKSSNPASISICNGLNGMIRTERDDYLIEPVNLSAMHGASDFIGQPHKLYKRSVLDSKHQTLFEAQKTAQKDIIVERGEDESEEVEVEEQSNVLIEDENYNSLDKSFHSVEKRAAYKYKFLREMNSPKTVEMLVVVDKNMYHKHGDANITTYTLTLFNMLSQLFKDGSLGNKIDVVLVGLILLEGDERGLTIDYNADDTLNSFCQWQSVLVGANGRQHDHAILLTGLDLCSYKNSPCDTLGFAPMEGMCNRVRSCTVNEDTGLSTAFTIAHEVGHNFGMFHDGEGNYCTESAGKIMSPTLMGKDGQFHWSVCSKAYLMRFLNTPQSDCLDDEPKQVAELKFPNKLPGELYNADIQCKWQFGSRARLCTYDFGKDICKALWCYRGNKRCETKFLPAAEGTSCGTGKWCRQGKCVDYGNEGPKPIDGEWSSWSEWSECSRTCGGGIITRDRECSRPLPQYGGKACLGEDKVFKMCNVIDCPVDADDFHTAQCATYNKQPFQGWYLQWKPQKLYNNENEPCKLHCIADTPDYVFTIKHTATDGMDCGIDEKKICVQGDCRPVGCDWVVGSTLHDDMCGVCDGDNSTCRLIQGEYLEQPKLNTYFPVTILPKSARSIRIREKSLSSNYLAVRNIFGKYFLNGHQRVAWPGTYTLAGAKFKYNRSYNVPETLEAEGPLEQELVLEILVQDHNPGIEYEYTLPKLASEVISTPPPDNYTWSLSVQSCSEPCAGGMKSVTAICHRNFDEEVESSFCEDLEKPKTGVFPCNQQPCEPRWVAEDWRPCTKMCGGGKQKRRVRCRQKLSRTKDKKLKRKMCKHLQKPVTRQRCNEQECPPDWHAADWSKCSVSCGMGTQVRKVTCRSAKGRKILPESMCHTSSPVTTQVCELRACNGLEKSARQLDPPCIGEECATRWVVSDWSVCSRDCAGGIQKRRVWCENIDNVQVKNKMCKHLKKPERRQACNEQDCPPAWHSGKWAECSTSCGSGVQQRRITCRTKDTNGHRVLQDDQCLTNKPDQSRSCYLGPCDPMLEEFDWLLSPWGPCSKSCGVGIQSRIVSCVNNRGQPSTFCSESTKPSSTQACNYGECLPTPQGRKWCKDEYSWCHLVPYHKVCNNPSYKEKCCKSCTRRG
ncbi:A disintegrin and metalloproteinase with thrombospondin motifs 18-like isoform X2 [Mercenaria mercenaria]|uniref:A disintegrin and metalloproteinase with thrombospondin motifs 18-like isoform X2 n=1 Tax=Mercenaria mercenaria TaxID=6596 RepID=UPI00234EA7C7|nr:A disintegrin and metalloproteinase with thrombospondin motifs 18-like isoform X2 [Mercenaria mercenaria]